MAVRLFVGNMPYGATEADLRTHFSAVGCAVPGRDPGGSRIRAATRLRLRRVPRSGDCRAGHRALQPAAVHGTFVVGQRSAPTRARRVPAEWRRTGRRRWRLRRSAAADGRRVRRPTAARGGWFPFRTSGIGPTGLPGKNFGPPKKKSASSEKRWEAKERGPKGPIKERYTGRMGGLYDDPNDEPVTPPEDFDDVASRAAEEKAAEEAAEEKDE